MPARQGPDWLALTLTPVTGASVCGIGAILHVSGQLSAGTLTWIIVTTAIITVIAAITSITSALAPHLPALCRERSHARVRRAVIEHKLNAGEAMILITGKPAAPAVRDTPSPPAKRLHRPL